MINRTHISLVFVRFQQGVARKGDHVEKGTEVCDYYRSNLCLVFSGYLPDPDSQFISTELQFFIFPHTYFIQLFRAPELSSDLEKHLYCQKHSNHVLTYRDGIPLTELLKLCDFVSPCIRFIPKIELKMSSLKHVDSPPVASEI